MANISPAAIYRLVKKERPTLLLDEAQSIVRRSSEASEIIRELFNAGIDRNACVVRCGGKQMDEVYEFPIYSPKVIALIGELDGVLADRCLPVRLERKTAEQPVLPYRSRVVEPLGKEIQDALKQWALDNLERVSDVYDTLDPFPIENDRMAELLLPLQAVLTVIDEQALTILEKYAHEIDQAEQDRMSPGTQLLNACRDIFGQNSFVSTASLLAALIERREEPWGRWNKSQEPNHR
jgi:hypothetical protein